MVENVVMVATGVFQSVSENRKAVKAVSLLNSASQVDDVGSKPGGRDVDGKARAAPAPKGPWSE